MLQFPAEIKFSKKDNTFLVEFPDLPGCLTYGDTLTGAQEMAVEALTGYLESIDMRKKKIPVPSHLAGKNIYYISPTPQTAFAIWMKLKRIEKGLTQQKAADLLGINFQSYQKYENPRRANPTLTTLVKIEKAFDEKILV